MTKMVVVLIDGSCAGFKTQSIDPAVSASSQLGGAKLDLPLRERSMFSIAIALLMEKLHKY